MVAMPTTSPPPPAPFASFMLRLSSIALLPILLLATKKNRTASFVPCSRVNNLSAGPTTLAKPSRGSTRPSCLRAICCDDENEMDGGGHRYGREFMDPPRMSSEEDGDDGGRRSNDNAASERSTRRGKNDDEEEDDGSEDNEPRRGRPGIVVFSGGTAFNAASSEMASRNFGGNVGSGPGTIWRSNSASSLVDLMAGGNDWSGLDSSNNNAPGGTKVWHVLPVTDDGGSTAEIVRVLGGPAVGDIRSRLLRLAPGTTREARAVRRLLGHRLVSMSSLNKERDGDGSVGDGRGGDVEEEVTHEAVSRMAREEWLDILDGGLELHQQNFNHHLDGDGSESNGHQNYEHHLWEGVSAPYRSIIRAFLVHFHNQVLQTHNGIRQSRLHPPFDFTGGSVGNFFFAGARTFFGSLPAAIFLFSKVAGIPSGSRVIPAVLSEERLVLGAVLKDGTRIHGQYYISHPQPKPLMFLAQQPLHQAIPQSSTLHKKNQRQRSDSGASFGRHRQVVKSSLDSRESISSLHPSPISKMAYLLHDPTWQRQSAKQNKASTWQQQQQQQQWSDRHQISPEPNPLVLDAISNANCVVYGCGSLFTSVLPSLVLEDVGPAISCRHVPKVLLLNGWHDSETSWVETSDIDDGQLIVNKMDCTSFVQAVVDALDQGGAGSNFQAKYDDHGDSIPLVTDYITHILYPIGTEIQIDEESLEKFCNSREERKKPWRKHVPIQVKGVKSIPADTCSEGIRSGGQSQHRVFNPQALVDALLDLASVGLNVQ